MSRQTLLVSYFDRHLTHGLPEMFIRRPLLSPLL
jgi:hypothetical protein